MKTLLLGLLLVAMVGNVAGGDFLFAAENVAIRGMEGRVLSAAEKAEFDAFSARARAQGLTESPYRTGSWGKMENGKFIEKARIDVGETGKPGFRGQTHIHIEGHDGHLGPTTKLPGEQ